MASRTDEGCGTPRDPGRKAAYRRLVELFAPVVIFHRHETFFPVDLPSTVRHASLWRVDRSAEPPMPSRVREAGEIDPVADLPAASVDHFVTVAGCGWTVRIDPPGLPTTVPRPRIEDVRRRYAAGEIPAELTVYGMVCRPREAPNRRLLDTAGLGDRKVARALEEGLLLNYLMYFPAHLSPEFESEGDWAGISLLLPKAPVRREEFDRAEALESVLPVLACYYRKTWWFWNAEFDFVAEPRGFRPWKRVETRPDPSSHGYGTHPVVHVSRGRHNCYYEPAVETVGLRTPWSFSPTEIESGRIGTAPALPAPLTGYFDPEEVPWWAYALFPPLLFFVMSATGCEYPFHFDRGGVPMPDFEGEDEADGRGFQGVPGDSGSPYPERPAPGRMTREVPLRIRYVDLDDAETAALWGYAQGWGAAIVEKYPTSTGSGPRLGGALRGPKRPLLAAWFMWNLFRDKTFGGAGRASPTPPP